MKTSDFTDKKVTELSLSHSDDFSDDDSDSSFRFRPLSCHFQNPNSMDRLDLGSNCAGTPGVGGELILVIDRKMEEYSKNLLHAVEALSVRLCQLETRIRKIEDSVGELKDSSVFNHGRTELKLKELENVLTKVQIGIRDLRDKQEISEAQIEMAKLQILRSNQRSDGHETKVVLSPDQPVSSSSQNLNLNLGSQQQYPTNVHPPPPMPTQPSSQIQFPSVQYYMLPPVQSSLPSQPNSSAAYRAYHPVPVQLPQPPLPYSPSFAVDPQSHSLPTHNFGRIPYAPPQTYNPGFPGLDPPVQFQKVNFGSRISESRHSCFDNEYSRYGPPSHYSGVKPSSSEHRPLQPLIPKQLPRALPMAAEINVGSGSGGSGKSVSIDDVVDNVVAMGFRRDLVRATVRKMTENGQSVELNIVLDKLMNSGEAKNESPRFGR